MNTPMETQWIDLNLLDVPEYGRKHSAEAIEALASDMAKNGQLQNAVACRRQDGRYELVIGKGRLDAARALGWEKIRADIKESLTPIQKLTMVAAENEAREDACPFYTAMLYQQISTLGQLTQQQLADQIGRTQALVSTYLALASVPKEVWFDVQSQLTSLRVCMEIAKAKDVEQQKKLVDAAVKDGLGSSAVRKLAKRLITGTDVNGQAAEEPPIQKAAYSFSWKGNAIVIKARPFQPHAQRFGDYLTELETAYNLFMETQTSHAA